MHWLLLLHWLHDRSHRVESNRIESNNYWQDIELVHCLRRTTKIFRDHHKLSFKSVEAADSADRLGGRDMPAPVAKWLCCGDTDHRSTGCCATYMHWIEQGADTSEDEVVNVEEIARLAERTERELLIQKYMEVQYSANVSRCALGVLEQLEHGSYESLDKPRLGAACLRICSV